MLHDGRPALSVRAHFCRNLRWLGAKELGIFFVACGEEVRDLSLRCSRSVIAELLEGVRLNVLLRSIKNRSAVKLSEGDLRDCCAECWSSVVRVVDWWRCVVPELLY